MVSYVTSLYETCSCGKCVVVEYPLKLVAADEEHMISSIIIIFIVVLNIKIGFGCWQGC